MINGLIYGPFDDGFQVASESCISAGRLDLEPGVVLCKFTLSPSYTAYMGQLTGHGLTG